MSALTTRNEKAVKKIITHLSGSDPVLKGVIEKVELDEIQSTNNVFHDLLSCIIEQQIHYRSTKKMFEKLMNNSGLIELTTDNLEQFEQFGLKDVKLSMRKWETLHDAQNHFESFDDVDWSQLDDHEVRKRLSRIKGIGIWTQDMILLYTLKRNNIFPVSDYHLKRIFLELYKTQDKKAMLAIASNWKPYASYATRYLLEFKRLKLN